jgi:hypothetical protein
MFYAELVVKQNKQMSPRYPENNAANYNHLANTYPATGLTINQ